MEILNYIALFPSIFIISVRFLFFSLFPLLGWPVYSSLFCLFNMQHLFFLYIFSHDVTLFVFVSWEMEETFLKNVTVYYHTWLSFFLRW